MSARLDSVSARLDADFKEGDHPRAGDGKFGSGGGAKSLGGKKAEASARSLGANFAEHGLSEEEVKAHFKKKGQSGTMEEHHALAEFKSRRGRSDASPVDTWRREADELERRLGSGDPAIRTAGGLASVI